MKKALLGLSFGVPVLWWAYLFLTTQPIVVFDSVGYEDQGRLILTQGFHQFIAQGPQREPLFPVLIAFSMWLQQLTHHSYFYFLKLIGILSLFITMLVSHRLMMELGIRRSVAAVFILYLGMSPVMTTTTMSIWSEWTIYPWVVLAVFWGIRSWQLLTRQDQIVDTGRVIRHALIFGLCFFMIMSGKAVAEGVFLLYLIPFGWQLWALARARDWGVFKKTGIFILTAFLVFEGLVSLYKWENWKANGHFTFTNRGDWAFYGNTVRRMEPLTPNRLGAAIAFAPGMGLCAPIFGQADCDFWSARHSDDIIAAKVSEIQAMKMSDRDASRYFITTAVQLLSSNPFQALLLMTIEAHKMFFWEASIAFVAFPDWLERIFYADGFIRLLKFLMAALSWCGFVFAIAYMCKGAKPIGWVLYFAFGYMAMYSLFFILDRYAFPIASLYIILVAFMVDSMISFIRRRAA